MIDADIQDLELIQEALAEFQKTEAQVVQSINLDDESISPAFRGQSNSLESINDALNDHLNREKARAVMTEVRESLEAGRALSPELLAKLTPNVISHTTAGEKRELLTALLTENGHEEALGKLLLVLESVDFGVALNAEGRSQLLPTDPDTLGRLLSLAPTLEQGYALADSMIRSQLEELARGLSNTSLREHYLSPERTSAELTGVLSHVSSSDRLEFVKNLLRSSNLDDTATNFIADKLDNVFHYFSASEKAAVVKDIVDNLRVRDKGDLVCKALRSCKGIDELVSVVDLVGRESLASLNRYEVDNYLAAAHLIPQVRDVRFPDRPSGELSGEELESYHKAFEKALEQIEKICESSGEHRWSRVAIDYLNTVSNDRLHLQNDLNLLSSGGATPSPAEMANLIEKYCAEAQVEFKYGVSLVRGASDLLSQTDSEAITVGEFGIDLSSLTQDPNQSQSRVDWTLEDIKHIEDILSRIPEGDVLFSDLLKTIERVPDLGWGVLGARYPGTGVIKIANLTIGNSQIARQYQGIDSLKIVLAHEIGHGLQIGNGRSGVYFPQDGDPYFGNGEEVHDFDEWMKLSDWKVYDRDRVSPSETPGMVNVDGLDLPLNIPVDLDGKKVVLQYNPGWNLLTSYNADADFSSRWYSKTSPWEDFAEAFSEYLYLPERLIKDAPAKFLHLDEEFKRYEGNTRLERLLEQSLERRRAARANGEEVEENHSHNHAHDTNFWVI